MLSSVRKLAVIGAEIAICPDNTIHQAFNLVVAEQLHVARNVFTQPSFQTHIEVLLGWVMCLSKRTEYGVFQTIQADVPVSRQQRHPFDRFYNFFSRSTWIVRDLAHQVAVAVVVQLNPRGLLYLVVDDTLLHKRAKTFTVWAGSATPWPRRPSGWPPPAATTG